MNIYKNIEQEAKRQGVIKFYKDAFNIQTFGWKDGIQKGFLITNDNTLYYTKETKSSEVITFTKEVK